MIRLYTIYKHTFPNNKVYIGITSQSVKKRWMNGKGYLDQDYMWKAIQKYGWENIKHEILYENLSLEEANLLEKKLITEVYKSNIREFGYNIDQGGTSGQKTSEETRKKLSEINKGKNNPMYGKKISDKVRKLTSERFKSIERTEEWRKKISEALKGRTYSKETKDRWSKTRKGRKWWNNGKIQTQSETCPGEGWVSGMLSKPKESTRKIWSKIRKGRKWWNNGIIQTQTFCCPEGFVPGMLPKKKISI